MLDEEFTDLYIVYAMLDLSLEYLSQEQNLWSYGDMAANTIQISNVGQNSVCEGWKDPICTKLGGAGRPRAEPQN